jgi:hypothetical protein
MTPFTEEVLSVRWYVVVNDLVGGFSISHINKPLSEQNRRQGEGELFDSATEVLARYVVGMHNAHLDARNIRLAAAGGSVYPTGRPSWLGPWQPWPCGKCGQHVADELHDCQPLEEGT